MRLKHYIGGLFFVKKVFGKIYFFKTIFKKLFFGCCHLSLDCKLNCIIGLFLGHSGACAVS